MSTVETALSAEVTGPMFDGSALKTFDRLEDELVETVADAGVTEVKSMLEGTLRKPTGFYVSQLQTERKQSDRLVTDGGVVYGPWLAGVSSRNRTSRFKGYTHWRRSAQRLENHIDRITGPIVSRRVQEMNA